MLSHVMLKVDVIWYVMLYRTMAQAAAALPSGAAAPLGLDAPLVALLRLLPER